MAAAKSAKDFAPLLRFWKRLQNNPSYRSVNMLYTFMEHKGIPIGQDGCILTYKSVRRDYTDQHSGQVDNSIGAEVSMPRNRISDDYDVECHVGFHVGNLSFASAFRSNGHIIVCKVDPADVVSVSKSDSKKMRVCRYKVIGHASDELPDTVWEDEILSSVPEAIRTSIDVEEEPVKGKEDHVEGDRHSDLMGMTLDKLRTYAKNELGVKNVKAIRGGKPMLVNRILEEEGKREPEKTEDTTDPMTVPGYVADKDAWKAAEAEVNEELEAATAPAPVEGLPTYGMMKGKSRAELLAVKLGVLRRYAGRVLEIPRASKIPGGKPSLVEKILTSHQERIDTAKPEPEVLDLTELPDDAIEVLDDVDGNSEHEVVQVSVSNLEGQELYNALNSFDSDALLTVNLDQLRKYARHELCIIGASKMKGGKEALVDRIIDVRSD